LRRPSADTKPGSSQPSALSCQPSGRVQEASQQLERTTMNVSPLDLRQQHFRSALRGFDKVEVTSFLLAAADDYEQALRETDRLRQEVTRLEAIVHEHREHERSLKTTLMAAQRLADDIKASAEQEARRITRD